MSFDVDIGHASARGPRALNEDFAGAVRAPGGRAVQGVIAAIADGVSGGGRGREAAQTTVIALLDDYFATPETWAPTAAMDRLIGAQNAWLAHHNRRGDGAALTTLTALAIQGQTWTVAHVGDTRAWLLRADAGDALQLLTQDHAFDHPDQRNRLTRAIGLDDAVRVDYGEGEVRIGDTYVLTSDGVHGVLKARQLLQVLRAAADAQAASAALVQAAHAAGSRDNATALVLRIVGLDARSLRDELGAAVRLPVPPALRIGDVLDGHVVTALVADTGVNRLYQARAPGSRHLVALKTLHPARASDPDERAMLAHEAWLGQRLAAHGVEGFVRAHERTADASALYTVFDWHQGRTVEQLMAGGARPAVGEVIGAAIAAARALARLHRLGVVHRDVKPANLHRDDDGRWRILDLGVALSGRERAAQRELHAGTPSYMNPEQWHDVPADARSDLFALGVTLYQWLTGRLPYGEIEPYQTARYRRDPAPPSRLRPDVPIWFDHVLRRAVARDPQHRFETAEELLLALERGASRPLNAPGATPLVRRDEAALWKIGLVVSLLFNILLVFWLLFLPR